jgi:hypothetical protein
MAEQDLIMPSFPTPQPIQYPSEKADFIDKIKPDIIVTTLMNRLQGKQFINGQWVQNPDVASRSLTERGAFDIANIMLSASSQNVSISKVNDADVRVRTKDTVNSVLIQCLRNWKEYGIKGSDQIHQIKTIVINNTFFTLKQPENGSIQKVITGTTHEQRLVQSNQQQGGMLDRIIRR